MGAPMRLRTPHGEKVARTRCKHKQDRVSAEQLVEITIDNVSSFHRGSMPLGGRHQASDEDKHRYVGLSACLLSYVCMYVCMYLCMPVHSCAGICRYLLANFLSKRSPCDPRPPPCCCCCCCCLRYCCTPLRCNLRVGPLRLLPKRRGLEPASVESDIDASRRRLCRGREQDECSAMISEGPCHPCMCRAR